jgi:hypothetical protein
MQGVGSAFVRGDVPCVAVKRRFASADVRPFATESTRGDQYVASRLSSESCPVPVLTQEELSVWPTQFICLFRVVLTINGDRFCKQH